MKKWFSWPLAAVFLVLLLAGLFLHSFILPIGHAFGTAAPYLWLIPFAGLLAGLIFFGWRLLLKKHGKSGLKGSLNGFISALVCILLLFLLGGPLLEWHIGADFRKKLPALNQEVTRLLAASPGPKEAEVPAALSKNGRALLFPLKNGKQAVFFVQLEQGGRLEGYAYLPGNFLYDEIIDAYAGYEYLPLSAEFVYLVLQE